MTKIEHEIPTPQSESKRAIRRLTNFRHRLGVGAIGVIFVMNNEAFLQARIRLEKAERAFSRLKAADNFDAAEDAWTDFLLAASAFYSKLQKGSEVNGRSSAWFGRKKHERKANPILRYLHAARNSDEHGIERITHRNADSNHFAEPQSFGKRVQFDDCHYYDGHTGEEIGEPFTAWAYGPHISCVRAKDQRYNDYCDPPPHEALPGKDTRNPIDIAEAAVPLLQNVLAEAAKFV